MLIHIIIIIIIIILPFLIYILLYFVSQKFLATFLFMFTESTVITEKDIFQNI